MGALRAACFEPFDCGTVRDHIAILEPYLKKYEVKSVRLMKRRGDMTAVIDLIYVVYKIMD